MLSVIIPAYNENTNVNYAYEKISSLLLQNKISYELIFINDGSTDNTWNCIKTLSKSKSSVHGISFSKNFGKEAAIMAGLSSAKGDCCVIIDCDLQHPPQTILEMYSLWTQGFEVIEGIKKNRGKEFFLHKLSAKLFYYFMSKIIGVNMFQMSDFKMLDRKVINELLKFNEKDIFFRALSSWVGFKTTQVEFEVAERLQGESKWSIKLLIKYAINNITSFSTLPLQMITILGGIYLASTLGVLAWHLFNNWDNLFLLLIILILFTGGVLMLGLGVIGYYLSKIYIEIKDRPRYIITETI